MVPVPNRVYSSNSSIPAGRQLQRIFTSIQRSANQDDIQREVMPQVMGLFLANRAALFLEDVFKDDARIRETVRNNPVVRYLRERHAPIHEAAILTAGQWSALCPRADHGHVLLGPVIGRREIAAVLGITRPAGHPPFDAEDIGHVAAICLHLGNWLTRLPEPSPALAQLTPRELQVARLVSEGLTNGQIAARLCVSPETVKASLKRIFGKLGIQKRSALAGMVSASAVNSSPAP